jgi:hypothetical protein
MGLSLTSKKPPVERPLAIPQTDRLVKSGFRFAEKLMARRASKGERKPLLARRAMVAGHGGGP